MVEQLAKGVYKIQGDCNVYLLLGKKNIVIDTGQPLERTRIKKEIDEVVGCDKIDVVLLTHLHYDHCGNVSLFPHASFFAAKEEIIDYQDTPEVFFFGAVPHDAKHFLDKLEPLQKGDFFGLRLGFVPGHTRGSVYVVDEKNKLLFSGDTVFRNGIGRTDFPNSLPEKMHDSIMKIINDLKENNLTLMPGHDY